MIGDHNVTCAAKLFLLFLHVD